MLFGSRLFRVLWSPEAAGGGGEVKPLETPPATKETVSKADYDELLAEKNRLATQVRVAQKGVKPAGTADPDDIARLNQEVETLKASSTKSIERVKTTALKSTAMELGFSGERQDAFLAIVKDKIGSKISVLDDDSVVYRDTAKNVDVPVADIMKELAGKYEFLKPPVQTTTVKGFENKSGVGGTKKYSELTTSESLKLDPEVRRKMALDEFNGARG